mgnify:FL=1|tara:strand:+ start:5665 stop:7053 length:1389 start_codon:yes stop_codon:yes gene_type:complete
MIKQQYRSFYSQDEMNIVNENLSSIQLNAEKIFNDKYLEPNNEEYDMVRNIIKNFIKSKERLVYGGYAQNELIKKKTPTDDFYGETRADIEFYSPEPVKDLIEICDLINEKKIYNVKGDEGMHPETYKIYANLENYCDISYMDPNIYKNCPYIELDGLKMTHPHMMIVDGYRIYTDLLTSGWRLDKAYFRSNLLEKNYPLPLTNEHESYKQHLNKEKHQEILRNVRKLVIMNSKFVVVGHYGVEYLTKKIDNKEIQVKEYPYYQLVTTNLKEDYLKVYNILKSIYGKKISYKKYFKYFMFWDGRIEFYYENQVILKLYGNNERCIVYQYSDKKKTYFGTFQLLILYLLIDYNYAQVYNIKQEEKNYLVLLNKLFKAKDIYMEENKIDILKPSSYQHFTTKCFGNPVNPMRDAMIKRIDNVKKGKMFKFSYLPKDGKKGVVPKFRFNNSSGMLIDTTKKLKKN